MYNSEYIPIENGQVILDEPLLLKNNTKNALIILEDVEIMRNGEPIVKRRKHLSYWPKSG
ncbi:MAG: hypothetical protein ACKVOU_07480 [Cytophagales bacterium]